MRGNSKKLKRSFRCVCVYERERKGAREMKWGVGGKGGRRIMFCCVQAKMAGLHRLYEEKSDVC